MTEQIRVTAGERESDEIIDSLESGARVIIETDILGTTYEVTLRYDGTVYYCDTPTTLHKHETADAMRQCLRNQEYVDR
ncbi:MAG: hypothetical protein ACI9PP_002373 [Halobacteriales archaeon]|jgi:hypothetical protein